MVEVARRWFGFESHDSLVAYTADGVAFVEAAAAKGGRLLGLGKNTRKLSCKVEYKKWEWEVGV